MNICGIVAEYNPFHNGHAYQAAQAREKSGCDYLVAVMGGAFSQRGEPMLLDKWTRTRMALQNGMDLVVELPALFAVRSADHFAQGGILTLRGMGCDSFCFGCEVDDMALLERLSRMEAEQGFSQELRGALEQGKSLARARGESMAAQSGLRPEQINAPNLALGLEYLRANQGAMKPLAVRRIGEYHSEETGRFASASAIRAAIRRGECEQAAEGMPPNAYELLCSAPQVEQNALDRVLLYCLRGMTAEQIADLPDVSEGLEHRIKKCCEQAGSREELLELLKCKRYTHARLSRICAQALLGLSREMAQAHPQPEYIRVLGFRKEASPLLKEISGRACLPLASAPVKLAGNDLFELERRATDLQALMMQHPQARQAGQDLRQKMVVCD